MRFWIFAAVIGLASLAMKLPVMLRQHAAQEEDYYDAPGWTILREGIPRTPYLASRDPECLFYKCDERMYAQPPLYFYWLAAVYAVLGPSTASARIACGLAGVVSTVLLAGIARRLLRCEGLALLVAGLYAFSRVVYFPWLIARMDSLCGMWGFAALLAMLWPETAFRRRSAALSGLFTGLGLLTHTFAIVYGIQCFAGVCVRSADRRDRIGNALIFGLTAAVPLLLWLPLILDRPDLFQMQFVRNVFAKAGPGILTRLLWPFPLLRPHAAMFFDHAGPLQAAILLLGLAGTGVLAMRSRASRTVFWLAASAVYLHITSIGIHPTKGYWCYTGGLLLIAVAAVVGWIAKDLARPRLAVAVALLTVASFVPGAGFRTVVAHLKRWDDPNYDSRKFVKRLLDRLPPDAIVAVDPAYVFEYTLAGRKTLLGLEYRPFFSLSQHEFDYLVAGEYALRDGVPALVGVRPIDELGDASDPFACHAVIYEPLPGRRPAGVSEK
ncbi:MAG TPA: glycosyltransferase family 39 protein [Caulifigura sp.]|nr:glycosyltransferase family 39 protein [Caulifigura sp.]